MGKKINMIMDSRLNEEGSEDMRGCSAVSFGNFLANPISSELKSYARQESRGREVEELESGSGWQ